MEPYEIDNIWQFFTKRSGDFMIQSNSKIPLSCCTSFQNIILFIFFLFFKLNDSFQVEAVIIRQSIEGKYRSEFFILIFVDSKIIYIL